MAHASIHGNTKEAAERLGEILKAAKAMTALLEPLKNVSIVEPVVTIRSAMKEADIPALEALADAMLA